MNIEIRQATANDVDDIARYFSELYATNPDTIFKRPNGIPAEDVLSLINASGPESGKLFLIARIGSNVVGTMTFIRHAKDELSHGGEFGMSVHQQFRRRGIGMRLIGGMEQWAEEQGIERIELQVWSNNLAGWALYEKAGYQREGIRKGAVKRGQVLLDIILMTKHIGQQPHEADGEGRLR